ncbi:adenylate/guanylate cyclase domain-containing protein [Leptospira meyeri]|uniref:adenylate/guanylate cyclase domain-containing protein n=1 Tax=Leptospira meyeri TaxID=29508 RepID=UPI0002BEE6B9|nr:adenylate/guanylate cyclase domain-containing protein [Leptospira meyeri]EMJ88984.1 adenylate/guanylate cyclase catalytic domain protein [Leptospira meyeri serovar Semaranga str. Veldrot Semarang 173]
MKNSEKILDLLGLETLPTTLVAFFDSSEPSDFFRINLKNLSEVTGVPFQDLLTIFLKLIDLGLFNLSWEYHCTHCNGIPGFKHNFSELKSEGECTLCEVSFRNTLDKNIEVTFTAHASFIEIPEVVFSEAKESMMAAVKEKRLKMPEQFVSGLECLNNETFRELFGEQVLSVQESLAVETVSFLFTDIKGSTQMYSDLGDAKSYDIVREHFKILFAAIARNNGIVVKTIGDAVMGSFLKPIDSLNAALEAHREFASRQLSQVGYLKIKMGIHSGSAIVVNLNRSVDYFGNSVNLAARVQGSVEDHEISFTKRILEDNSVHSFLKSKRAHLRRRMENFKGINGAVDVYTLSADTIVSWTT